MRATVTVDESLLEDLLSVTQGENEHRLDEYIETGPLPTGIKTVLLALVALTRKA